MSSGVIAGNTTDKYPVFMELTFQGDGREMICRQIINYTKRYTEAITS